MTRIYKRHAINPKYINEIDLLDCIMAREKYSSTVGIEAKGQTRYAALTGLQK